MIDRPALVRAAGSYGEEPCRTRTEGVHVNRKRTATHPHSWRNGRCTWCGMLPSWPGGRRPCEAIYAAHRAKSEAKQKATATALRMLRGTNEEARAASTARASVTETEQESR